MPLTDLHVEILNKAFETFLGEAEGGAVAFARFLAGEIGSDLAANPSFSPEGWDVFHVADEENREERTLRADQAVELREAKGSAMLLLVDTARAGAGMDGIYSAAREVKENDLFKEAVSLAAHQVTRRLSRDHRLFAENAIKKARRLGLSGGVSAWSEFDFFVRTADAACHPGEFFHLIGLWPVQEGDPDSVYDGLEESVVFMGCLLGKGASGESISQRIESLHLREPSEDQNRKLRMFLRGAGSKPLLEALAELSEIPELHVNRLRMESGSSSIRSVEVDSWRGKSGKILKWSGLQEHDSEEPPCLIIDPDATHGSKYSKLEVRWRARPDNLEKGACQYHVKVSTDMGEELAARDVPHNAKQPQKCTFTNDDFEDIGEDAFLPGNRVVVSVIDNDNIESQETEEFSIRAGDVTTPESASSGKPVRTLSEGVIELEDREEASALASSPEFLHLDKKGEVTLKTRQRDRKYRVASPLLLQEIASIWTEQDGAIGRWTVRVRTSGERVGLPEFVPFEPVACGIGEPDEKYWTRVSTVNKALSQRFAVCGGAGLVYDTGVPEIGNLVEEYTNAWAGLIEKGSPCLSLAHTVEVQSLSGKTIGLIVLPSHPLRVAWHVAYDSLVLHARFEQEATVSEIRSDLGVLDGSMFPAFLPGLGNNGSFVFADTLGFHAVGMVLDKDPEPKAAVAVLARALGGRPANGMAPTVGKKSAEVLGDEIVKYLESHGCPHTVHLHALRPGDGLTVARALGRASAHYDTREETGDEDALAPAPPNFVLEMYPSERQQGIAGRFITEARRQSRSSQASLPPEDQWMFGSVDTPNGITFPRLRWARKDGEKPTSAAHLAIAFDTFNSDVRCEESQAGQDALPLYAFGLLSFLDRRFTAKPMPQWRGAISVASDGEKHPAERGIQTRRLLRIQKAVLDSVRTSLGGGDSETPTLYTEVLPDKAESMEALHSLCDWVITLDRNAGLEYFDSPVEMPKVYDAYVIDCVPEREDLGCMQLITSTGRLEEIQGLLDDALDQMGLSRSRRNAEFLFENLKTLSGRLAIRLTGRSDPIISELIGLALCNAYARSEADNSEAWMSLDKGFFIPVDDVQDLLPPLDDHGGKRKKPQDASIDESSNARPDLIHVSVAPRKGLVLRFAEVKYRRYLRSATSAEIVRRIHDQVASLRKRWDDWYRADAPSALRAVRRAKLARVLRFYAERARRHGLPGKTCDAIMSEIDSMLRKGPDYQLASEEKGDRGWIFCPEFQGARAAKVYTNDGMVDVYLFGPVALPNPGPGQRETGHVPPARTETETEKGSGQVTAPLKTERSKEEKPVQTSAPATVDRAVAQPADDSLPATHSDDDARRETQQTVPSVRLGGDPVTHGEVRWSIDIKGNPHLMVVGLPGMGKTTCLLNICRQMLEQDIHPILFSYHQDIDERLSQIVPGVRFVDFRGLGFNPLRIQGEANAQAYLDVAGAMRDIFTAIFPELGDIQGDAIRQAIKRSFLENGWDNSNAATDNLQVPAFVRFLEILREEPKPDKSHRTLLSRLEELADYGFFNPGDEQESLWESKEPVVVRIHGTQNEHLQKAFASLVFYGLYKDMFRRGLRDRITHAIIFDEAHRAAKLRLIPTMAKECRKYGVSLVLASQEAKDFHTSLYSAIANYLVLRLTETDAKALVRNVASTDQERSLTDRIKQMERFKAVYFCEGRRRPSTANLDP